MSWQQRGAVDAEQGCNRQQSQGTADLMAELEGGSRHEAWRRPGKAGKLTHHTGRGSRAQGRIAGISPPPLKG